MSEDEFYKKAEVVKLDTLSDVNDIGKPWRYEEDGLTVTRTSPWSPPGCHPVGCGLKLYVNDEGRLVRVEGDENNPVTQGRLCPRCIALKDYIYNPARLLYPMKRDPKDRGNADAWEQITWDEAFDIIKKEYDRITAAYGRESIVVFAGTGREGGTFAPYGTMCFGTPNFCYTQSGYACYTPRLAAIAYIAGTTYPEWDYAGALPGRWDDERYELTECLVVWGKAPLESNPDGFFGHAVIDAMRRGTRLIVIDPRVNWLATRADIHLQLRASVATANTGWARKSKGRRVFLPSALKSAATRLAAQTAVLWSRESTSAARRSSPRRDRAATCWLSCARRSRAARIRGPTTPSADGPSGDSAGS